MFVFHFYIYVIIIRFIEQGICICVIRITLLLLFFYDQMINKVNYIHSLIYSFIHCIFHAKPENLYKCVHSSSNAIFI